MVEGLPEMPRWSYTSPWWTLKEAMPTSIGLRPEVRMSPGLPLDLHPAQSLVGHEGAGRPPRAGGDHSPSMPSALLQSSAHKSGSPMQG